LLTSRREFVRNIHPAYCSVLVSFDPRKSSPSTVEDYLVSLIQRIESTSLPPQRSVEIPVCYGGERGPDLADVAAHNSCSPDDVVRIHSSGEYLVYFLGFSPGFPYMGGLSPKIATPRLATPRTRVPAGSVAIGGSQTGVYPVSSPGGWRIIGRTPLRLFRPNEQPPVLLQMGDIVHFTPITYEEFAQLMSN
jgi:inhibitor of KinA